VDSISKGAHRARLGSYFLYATKWLEDLPPEQIASELGFASPAHMYQSFARDGFSVCAECGETPVANNHFKKHRRRAHGSGTSEKLPPSNSAVDLFGPVVEALSRSLRTLDHHAEWYGAGRFEKADEYALPGGVRFWRDTMPEKDWRALCEKHGQGAHLDSFTVSGRRARSVVGGSATPRETALIAAYFLIEGPQGQTTEQNLEFLLDALHRNPHEADRQKLLYGSPGSPEQHPGKVEELRRAARQVARLVRGAPIGGSPAEELTNEQLDVAWYIEGGLRSGTPYTVPVY